MEKTTLFLIDATAFCYRAYYAIKDLSTSYGQATNAVFGFIRILKKLMQEQEPKYVAVCFDVSRDTFRQKKFADYKIQRPPMPDGLSTQLPLIREVIKAYNLVIMEKEGFEADDVIATLNSKAKEIGWDTVIVSSDKDMLQLVDKNTKVFNPYKDDGFLYDTQEVKKGFGVEPKGIPEVISLMGDSVDNIPGIPGIGEKTALNLIEEFGTVQNIIKNLEKVKQDKVQTAIRENIDTLKLNHELAVLDDKVPVDFDPEILKVTEPDYRSLFEIFKRLEFRSFLKELPIGDSAEETECIECSDGTKDYSKLISELKEEKRLVVGLDSDDSGGIYLSYRNGKIAHFRDINKGLEAFLQSKDIKKIGHDLKKTAVILKQDGVTLSGLEFDTMIAAYVLDSSKTNYSIQDTAWDYLEKAISDKGITKAQEIGLITKLERVLKEKLEKNNLEKVYYELEMPFIDVLVDMESDGVCIDTNILSKLSKDLEHKLSLLIEEIFKYSGTEFNINSPKQLSQILFEKLKLPIIKKTKTGISTDEEVLVKLASQHKLPAKLIEYRQLTKLKSTYVDALPKLVNPKTGKIHASFNQTGTETGRLSSSNPNLQNIPIKTEIGRQIRSAFVPREKDSVLLSSDYSQIDLRVLAHLSKDKNLIEAFDKDQDIHTFTASLIFDKKQDEVTPQMRETAKRINFGIVYGMSSYGLSKDLDISQEEAQRFIDSYFLRYSRVKDFMENQIKSARKNGFVVTLSGRPRYIPNINSKNNNIRQFCERQAINTPVQGSSADLIKFAMISIHKRIKDMKLKSHMILQVHDELVFDVPRKELKEIQELVRDRMENVVKLDVPLKVNIKKGDNWLQMQDV